MSNIWITIPTKCKLIPRLLHEPIFIPLLNKLEEYLHFLLLSGRVVDTKYIYAINRNIKWIKIKMIMYLYWPFKIKVIKKINETDKVNKSLITSRCSIFFILSCIISGNTTLFIGFPLVYECLLTTFSIIYVMINNTKYFYFKSIIFGNCCNYFWSARKRQGLDA